MARYYAVISSERGTQVSRIGHRRLEVFLQTNSQRVEITGEDDVLDISISRGRYDNAVGDSGHLATVKDGKIYVSDRLRDKIVFYSGKVAMR